MKPTRLTAFRGAHLFATIASVVTLGAFAACSGNDRAAGTGGDGFRPPVEGAPCVEGQVKACGVEVGSHGGVVDCVKGTQTCLADKSWSTCATNGVRYTAKAPAPKSGSDDPKLGSKVVGGTSTICTDNPCNPFCKSFDDLPDTGITTDAVVTVDPGPTITIDEVPPGAIPGGFIDKGSINAYCGAGATAAQRASACQFDQHCGVLADGTPGCVPFLPKEKDNCTGIDITSPPVCSPTDTATYRNLGICNRGSAPMKADVICMGYPGNKPQYPNDSPGLGTLVLDTSSSSQPISPTSPLNPGECRTYTVPNANFVSMGTESIMCNVPDATGALSTIESVPTIASSGQWLTPANATNDGDFSASATATMSRTSVAQDATGTANNVGWDATTVGSMTGATDTAFATASFVDTSAGFSSPATVISSSCASSSCTNWATITATGTAVTASVATQLAATGDGRIRATLTTNDITTVRLGGLSFPSVPATATIATVTIRAKWSSSSVRNTATVRVLKVDAAGAATTVATFSHGGGAFGDVDTPSLDLTESKTIAVSGLTAADLPGLQVEVEASRTATGSGSEVVTVDHVAVDIGYVSPPQTATIDATFPAFAIPAGSSVEGFMVTAIWTTDTQATRNVFGIQPVLASGTALGEAVGTLPSAYPGGTVVMSRRAWTGAFSASDLAAGFKLRVRAERGVGSPNPPFRLGVDSLNVTAFYRTGPAAPVIDFSNFGFKVPATATNVRVSTFTRYQASPATTDDWLQLDAYAGATVLNTGAAAAPATFTLFQVGSTFIVNPADLEDGTFHVKLTGTRLLPGTGTTTHSIDYVKAVVTYEGNVTGHTKECNESNNWTVSKSNPGILCEPITTTMYPPWTVTRVFDGVCGFGTKPRWRRFGYDTSTPTATKVEFRFRAFPRNASGACVGLTPAIADPPVPFAVAQLAPTDTQKCDLSALPTSFCPVDLTTKLDVAANEDCLQMDARGVPASSPAVPAAPTLNSWRVTYDCVPSE